MKRAGNLWTQISGFENLLLAARQAEKSKRFRPNVLDFNFHLDQELWQLHEALATKTYQPGEYRTFKITEPTHRLISAAPYRDRVIHHALCQIIGPILERGFTDNSYANRVGYGSHRALRKLTKLARTHRYILQCDIKKYFPSIDHQILKDLIRHRIKCPDTLWLIDTIIDGSNPQFPTIDYFPGDDLLTPLNRRRGLPLGNLSSQFFANLYLNGLDHFVRHRLQIPHYVRYVDDFALLSNDHSELQQAQTAIVEYLQNLRLKLHPVKTQIFATQIGIGFLGFRVLPQRIKIRNKNLRTGRRRLKKLKFQQATGQVSMESCQKSIQSWIAHLNHADTWHLQQQLFVGLSEPTEKVTVK
jgi:retron-type reverse transcriptase